VSGAYTDARLKNDYFGKNAYTGKPGVLAPAGQQLPVTPPVKLNAIARYTFPLGEYKGHLQGALVYSESSWADLRTNERNTIGKQGAYELVDFTTGIENDRLTFEIYVKNAFNGRGDIYRYPECPAQVCGAQTYRIVYSPRTIGVRLGQKF
jgi:iron complex outermembrane receptor protein